MRQMITATGSQRLAVVKRAGLAMLDVMPHWLPGEKPSSQRVENKSGTV